MEWAVEILKAVSPAVSWALVIAGWFVVSRDHNKREKRKEIRGELQTLHSHIRIIESEAHAYLVAQNDPSNSARAAKIKRDLKRLSTDLSRICAGDCRRAVSAQLVDFRQAVTGSDFESAARTPCNHDSVRLAEVAAAADELMSGLDNWFCSKYT
jgi:hypothetical protein